MNGLQSKWKNNTIEMGELTVVRCDEKDVCTVVSFNDVRVDRQTDKMRKSARACPCTAIGRKMECRRRAAPVGVERVRWPGDGHADMQTVDRDDENWREHAVIVHRATVLTVCSAAASDEAASSPTDKVSGATVAS